MKYCTRRVPAEAAVWSWYAWTICQLTPWLDMLQRIQQGQGCQCWDESTPRSRPATSKFLVNSTDTYPWPRVLLTAEKSRSSRELYAPHLPSPAPSNSSDSRREKQCHRLASGAALAHRAQHLGAHRLVPHRTPRQPF